LGRKDAYSKAARGSARRNNKERNILEEYAYTAEIEGGQLKGNPKKIARGLLEKGRVQKRGGKSLEKQQKPLRRKTQCWELGKRGTRGNVCKKVAYRAQRGSARILGGHSRREMLVW